MDKKELMKIEYDIKNYCDNHVCSNCILNKKCKNKDCFSISPADWIRSGEIK